MLKQFLSNIIFLVIIWKFPTIQHIILPSQSFYALSPSLMPYLPPNKKYTKLNLCCPCAHWSMARLPVASLLQKTESFSTLVPEAIHYGELHFRNLITTLRSLSNGFLSTLFLFWQCEGCHRSLKLSLILNYESLVIDTTAKEASLPIAARGSMEQ